MKFRIYLPDKYYSSALLSTPQDRYYDLEGTSFYINPSGDLYVLDEEQARIPKAVFPKDKWIRIERI